MNEKSSEQPTDEFPAVRLNMDLLDFSKGSYLVEDRWLRFMIRLGFVLFVISLEAIVIVAVARLLWVKV